MFRIICLTVLLTNIGIASPDCHPEIDIHKKQFLIGYGSLLENKSKNETYVHTGENIPVIVKGYTRGWYIQGKNPGFNTTFLGVIPDAKGEFNGAYFELHDRNAIKYYDQREIVYCRKEVQRKNLVTYNHHLSEGQYWIYYDINNQITLPTANTPIVQSYVDIFMNGCLEIEKKYKLKDYAKQCILTTKGWSSYWVNDRIYPRIPYAYQPNALVIDTLLKDNIPQFFDKIKLE